METKLTKEIKLALLQRTNQKIGTYGAFEVSFGSRYILEKKLKSDVTMQSLMDLILLVLR